MDKPFTPRPIAHWYMPAAIACLLFMLLAFTALVVHLTTDPATLPLDQRRLFEVQPDWVLAASAVASIVGAVGALFLILRHKAAVPLLLVSLAAVLVWLAGLMLITPLRDTLTTNDIAVALAVTALSWTIYWFARHSRQRGWLR
jgi:hypothetical protein